MSESGSGIPSPDDLYSFRALYRHYRACRRNKRNTLNALAFEIDAEGKLRELQTELRAHTYRPGQSICFVTDGPKPREVFAADFRDRIVHHLLVAHQERLFEPIFIHDTYACRRGRGALAASNRLMTFLRRVTANGKRPAWSIKLDVASFFPSIHKETLCTMLERRTRHPELRWLTRTILFHDPTTDYRFRSLHRGGRPGTRRYPVPDRKSLFSCGNARGLPIGNLTSQFWANVYLNEVDQLAKHALRCRYYLRYVDDLVLLSTNPDELVHWRDQIAAFVRQQLRLELRPQPAQPQRVSEGVEFVGWRTWFSHRVARRQTLATFCQRLATFERKGLQRAFGGAAHRIEIRPRRLAPPRRPASLARAGDVSRLGATLASYSGHLRHGAAWLDWSSAQLPFRWLSYLFVIDGWRVQARWAHLPLVRLVRPGSANKTQTGLTGTTPSVLVFNTVGRYVEFHGPQRVLAQQILGLRPVPIARFGWALTAGFPLWRRSRFVLRALTAGVGVVLPRQHPRRATLLMVPCVSYGDGALR